MTNVYLGEIRDFGFNFAPKGWAKCDGTLLEISKHRALFDVLGTVYGGDGIDTFALPDLRGRVPLSIGHRPGLSSYARGDDGGLENVVMVEGNIPPHNHELVASIQDGKSGNPKSASFAKADQLVTYNTDKLALEDGMSEHCISKTGASQPITNQQPYLVTNFCIALVGS